MGGRKCAARGLPRSNALYGGFRLLGAAFQATTATGCRRQRPPCRRRRRRRRRVCGCVGVSSSSGSGLACTQAVCLRCVFCRSENAFLVAVQRLGGLDSAKPKTILQLLAPDFPELTRQVRPKCFRLIRRRHAAPHTRRMPARTPQWTAYISQGPLDPPSPPAPRPAERGVASQSAQTPRQAPCGDGTRGHSPAHEMDWQVSIPSGHEPAVAPTMAGFKQPVNTAAGWRRSFRQLWSSLEALMWRVPPPYGPRCTHNSFCSRKRY